MDEINYLAIVVATVAGFVAAGGYYAVLGDQLAAAGSAAVDDGPPPALMVPIELVRTLVVTVVVAGLSAYLGVTGLTGSLLLAAALWIGFPAVLLSGSVVHEKVPWKLAAIHAGDWLLKLVIISLIVGLWH